MAPPPTAVSAGRIRKVAQHGRGRLCHTCHLHTIKKGSEWTCKPGSVLPPFRGGDGHFSRKPIARLLQRSTRKSIAGRTSPRDRAGERVAGRIHCSLFDLAPGGVCLARLVAQPAGELLPHRFTLTARARSPHGGLLSVALSRALRPVGVTHHPVLRSPDFPPADAAFGPIWRPWRLGRRPSGPLRTIRKLIAAGEAKGDKRTDDAIQPSSFMLRALPLEGPAAAKLRLDGRPNRRLVQTPRRTDKYSGGASPLSRSITTVAGNASRKSTTYSTYSENSGSRTVSRGILLGQHRVLAPRTGCEV